MKNSLLNRAIAALNNAGFDVVKYSRKEWGPLKLKVIPNSVEPGELGYKQPEAVTATVTGRYPGETCNLQRLLGASDWRHTLSLVQGAIRAGNAAAFNVGDFIRVKFDVPAASHEGLKFPALHVDAKVQIIDVEDDKAIFFFDDIIFKSAINARDKNEGGFAASALAKYLNTEFLAAMDISGVLLENHAGLNISLPMAFELFGDEEYWAPESNYQEEPHQIEYFLNEKNRVKSFENETHWYWTASVRASSAAAFCGCGNGGSSNGGTASAVGGVAPAFCVA